MAGRFQVKITGSETTAAPKAGKVKGWQWSFYSCDVAPIALLVNGNAVVVGENLAIPAGAQLSLKMEGAKDSTAGLHLVLEE